MTDIDVPILPNPERFDGYPCHFIKAGPATVPSREPDSEGEFYVAQGDDYSYVHKDFVVFPSEPWKPNNPVEFDTIQVGDQIAVESTHGGFWVGVVTETEPNQIELGDSWSCYGNSHIACHLLHRPEAPKPKPVRPVEIGASITNATIRGESGHSAVRISDLEWRSFTLAGNTLFHLDEHVTEWVEGTVVPVTTSK